MSRRKVSLVDRFWANVETSDGCWMWTGPTNRRGYGVIGEGGREGHKLLAHRVSWVIANGAVPDGLFVCHTCDNPPCVRPDHLWLGTNAQNIADASSKRRLEGRGGKLTIEQVRAIRSSTGTLRADAPRFGVSYATISRVRRGEAYRTWV